MESKFKSNDFFYPDRFVTPMDTHAYGAKQFAKGMAIGKAHDQIDIAVNDCWGAKCHNPSKGYIASYEKLGYHANTCDLLKGFIASGCTLIVHRWIDDKLVSIKIQ